MPREVAAIAADMRAANVQHAAELGIEAMTGELLERARDLVPVVSGALYSSIEARKDGNALEIRMGPAGRDYGAKIEETQGPLLKMLELDMQAIADSAAGQVVRAVLGA